jgi:hypothetical protein
MLFTWNKKKNEGLSNEKKKQKRKVFNTIVKWNLSSTWAISMIVLPKKENHASILWRTWIVKLTLIPPDQYRTSITYWPMTKSLPHKQQIFDDLKRINGLSRKSNMWLCFRPLVFTHVPFSQTSCIIKKFMKVLLQCTTYIVHEWLTYLIWLKNVSSEFEVYTFLVLREC